ncbi:MAG: hypothetical protein J7K75_01140 [Desulfuromonas sp.]|nr:hypothetical protein [Desulfuromonas sp.]
MRTSNPMMKENAFTAVAAGEQTMTLQGAVNKDHCFAWLADDWRRINVESVF